MRNLKDNIFYRNITVIFIKLNLHSVDCKRELNFYHFARKHALIKVAL